MRRAAAFALLLALLGCGPSETPRPSPIASRPAPTGLNVLLITIDTLRADHLGAYGYHRKTSPNIDALAAEGTLFEAAYTFWPKTRGSFVMIHTGRRPSQNGYGQDHPVLLGFNPTIADVLQKAGYATAAFVDNPNVAAQYGYSKGFETYRQTWEEKGLVSEMERARAITDGGIGFLAAARAEKPFFLWVHYVNPHAPYTPPAPFDTAFLDAEASSGPQAAGRCRIPRRHPEAVGGEGAGSARLLRLPVRRRDRRGRPGGGPASRRPARVARSEPNGDRPDLRPRRKPRRARLLFRPRRGPLRSQPGHPVGRRRPRRSPWPAQRRVGFDPRPSPHDPRRRQGLLSSGPGGHEPAPRGRVRWRQGRPPVSTRRTREGSTGAFDRRFKAVATPSDAGRRVALYDRQGDRGETRDLSASLPEDLRQWRLAVDLFVERGDREWARTRPLVEQHPEGEGKMTPEACEKMRALGYVRECAP